MKEKNTRLITKFPPYTTIVRVAISASSNNDAQLATQHIYNDIKALQDSCREEFVYLQAMKSPLNRIQTKYRYQVLMRLRRPKENEIIKQIYKIVDNMRIKDIVAFVEINPESLI